MHKYELEERIDSMAFVMPEEYKDEEEIKDIENKLMLCRLFIDSYKVLTYEEFTALQSVLVITQCWDSRPDTPISVGGGLTKTFDPVPLTMNIIAKIMETDFQKLVSLISSTIKKLPILSSIIEPSLIKELKDSSDVKKIKEKKNEEQSLLSIKQLKENGMTIRKNLIRENEILLYTCDQTNKQWFNNGKKSILATECPKGYVKGKLSKFKYS